MQKFTIAAVVAMTAFAPITQAKKINDTLTSLDPQTWVVADGWENGYPFVNDWTKESVSFSDEAMAITLSPTGNDAWTGGEVRSREYFANGCFKVEMKPVRADGVVSSIFLFAGPDDQARKSNGEHNEIDIEFLGMNTNMVQFNYWTNDDDYANSHEHLHYLDFDAADDFHQYAIEWTKKYIKWYIDGELVYQVKDSARDPIPSRKDTKFKVMTNVWATHPDISNWAGEFDLASNESFTGEFKNYSYNPGKCHFR